MKPIDKPTMKKARQLAAKRLRFMKDKQINENLECFCGSLAEAFKAGAEEAQQQICSRLDQELAREAV